MSPSFMLRCAWDLIDEAAAQARRDAPAGDYAPAETDRAGQLAYALRKLLNEGYHDRPGPGARDHAAGRPRSTQAGRED
jgi:hypothetical protein